MNRKLSMILTGSMLALAAGSAVADDAHAVLGRSTSGTDLVINLAQGEVFTVAVSRHRVGGQALMKAYFKAVLPIAKPLGFAPRGALHITESVAGPFEPNNFVGFYGFPSTKAATAFANDPRWPAVKATRPEIWSELRISHYVVKRPTRFTLRADRAYEVRYEWGASPAIEPGGTIVADFKRGTHEMLPKSLGEPTRIRIIAWPSLAVAKADPRPQSADRVDSLYTQVKPGA